MAGLLPLLLLPVLMYFLLIRPQQRKVREQQALLSAVEVGDEVMTTSGMYGYINIIDGDTVWLEIAPNVEIRISKGAIARRVIPDDATTTEPETSTSDGDNDGDQTA
jgi:preprotein translocase subunit YajC